MTRTVVIAPDSFKGTIAASAAAEAIAAGWRQERPDDDIRLLPMADGGEGTLEAFATAVPGAERVPVRVIGPDDREVDTFWLRLPASDDAPGGTAIVELGVTSGIELLAAAAPAAGRPHLRAGSGDRGGPGGGRPRGSSWAGLLGLDRWRHGDCCAPWARGCSMRRARRFRSAVPGLASIALGLRPAPSLCPVGRRPGPSRM